MTETVTRLTGLDDAELTAMHKRFDEYESADAAIVQAHHLVTIEMLKRNIPHGHVDDAWTDAVVLIEKTEVSSPDEISAPQGMEKAWAQTLHAGGTVSVLLTTDGYVLKADPTVSDVHVDAVMGSGRKRPRKYISPAEMQKTIKEEDGKYVVYSEDLSRRFGTYETVEQAEARLAQIERFKKESGFAVPDDVQTAAKRAMKWISEGKAGDGFTSVGRGRARQLANGGSVSRAVLVKMRAYFARHGEQRGDHASLDDGEPTPWRVAWDAWGGDPGRTWANKVLGDVEKAYDPEDMLTDKERALYDAYETVADDHGEFTPLEAHYMSAEQNPFAEQGMNCANCVFFEGGGGCEILTEQVDPMGLCKLWVISGNLLSKAAAVLDDEETYLAALSAEDKDFYAAIARSLDAGDEPDFIVAKRGNPEALRDYWRGGGKGKISWGAGGDFTSCVAAVGKYMTSEEAKGYCAIRHREVTAMWRGGEGGGAKRSREGLATFARPGGATYEFSVRMESVGTLEPISKHGKHDQKTHAGKGGVSGDVDPEIAASIIERVRVNGGLSVSMVDGSEPPDGYMVARVGVKAAIVDADDFYDDEKGPAALSSFMKDNKAELTGGDYLGVWHDKEGGKVYLDVSENVKDRATAERLGSPSERNQISIWDVVEGKEIPTGGTGELEKAKAFRGDQVTGSVANDRRGDRRLREKDLVELQPEISKHLSGKHDQSSHARGGGRSATTGEGGGAGVVEYGGYKLNPPDNPPGETGKRDADSIDAAKKERAKVAAIEPEITRDMIDVANANGAKMDGLDYRLKSEKSLARKINDEKDVDFDGDATKTAENMSDVARYTMTYKDNDYVAGTERVIEDLRSKGYEMRVKNYWQDGDPYQGINISAVHPNGTKFELQMHTPTSLDFKEPTHAKYDKYRESKSPKVRYKEYTSMRRIANQIPKPPPPGALAQIGEAKFQPFMPTPESSPVAI